LGAIRKRGKHYVVDYYDATGRRRWETIGPNLHEAKQVLAQREWERRHGKYRLTRQAITMAEFITNWEKDYLVVRQQLERLKESTLVSRPRISCFDRLHCKPTLAWSEPLGMTTPHQSTPCPVTSTKISSADALVL
jgi:hypothetical protein